jgi:ABC-2 type transport system ATP-binding protein
MPAEDTSSDPARVLELDRVVRSYGPVRAIDGVSLRIAAGELVALLGPNGAGKSTLFQLLSGLFTPDEGHIAIMGHDMARDPVPALAGIGIVFQQPTLDLELTVADNLRFHAGLHGIPRREAERRISTALERVGLAQSARAKAGSLSGGNRRRVELARAVLHEPRVLLMDEPTVGLDPASRADLVRFVGELRSTRAVAVLWATHLCDEVTAVDRVVVMHRGRILLDAPPAGLLAATSTPTIEAAFLKLTGA